MMKNIVKTVAAIMTGIIAASALSGCVVYKTQPVPVSQDNVAVTTTDNAENAK